MPSLVLHKMWSLRPLSLKAKNRAYKRYWVEQASKNIDFTLHWEQRLKKRFHKTELTIKKNIIASIVSGNIKYNSKYKTYKIYWNFGIYILWEDLMIITVMNEKRKSVLDPYYLPVDKDHRKKLLKDIWLKHY